MASSIFILSHILAHRVLEINSLPRVRAIPLSGDGHLVGRHGRQENLTDPMKASTFVTHFGKGVHWDGAKDEDTTLLIIGEGPATGLSLRP
jgi:hypothetical protein